MLVAGLVSGGAGVSGIVSGAVGVAAPPPAELHSGANPRVRERLTMPRPAEVAAPPETALLFGSKPAPGFLMTTPPALPPPAAAAPPGLTAGAPSARVALSLAVPPQAVVTGPFPSSLASGVNPRPPTVALVALASSASPLPPDVRLIAGLKADTRPWLTVAQTFPVERPLPGVLSAGANPLPPTTVLVARASAAAENPPDVLLWAGSRAFAGYLMTTPVPPMPEPIPVVRWFAPIFLAGPPLVSKLPLGVDAPPIVRLTAGAVLPAARALRVVDLPLTVAAPPLVSLQVGAKLPPAASLIRVALPLLVAPAPTVQLVHGAQPVFTPIYVRLPTTTLVSSSITTSVI